MNDKLKNLQSAAQSREALLGTISSSGSGPVSVIAAAARSTGPSLLERAVGFYAAEDSKPPARACRQCLYVSVFFDGTGNHRDYDVPTFEHSNVAKLFRAHPVNSDARGAYRVYVPGIGTPFPAIGDKGQGPIPLVDTHNGMGAMGQKRLDWVFDEIQRIVRIAEARAMNPSNNIVWIRVAVFGFSRGATLARGFVRDLLDPRLGKTKIADGEAHWIGATGAYPLSVEFMGLWDTVASVGFPMSANNAGAIRSLRRWKANMGRAAASGALRKQPEMLRAVDLAFGQPGADPSPGSADGHGAWADGLAIHELVKKCVHFVAGHEVRNSFPVDSVQRGPTRGSNCEEYVYPGAHADVGGGYRPGEGGRGNAGTALSRSNQESARELLSLISLRAMYDKAIVAGVPMRRRGGDDWNDDNNNDFAISDELIARFNHYMGQIGWGGVPIGQMMLRHMRFWFAWRWYRIAQGRAAEKATLEANQMIFAAEQAKWRQEKRRLERALSDAIRQETMLTQSRTSTWSVLGANNSSEAAKRKRDEARAEVERLQAKLVEVDAKMNLGADDEGQWDRLNEDDGELVDDVRGIIDAMAREPALRAKLRPHYKNLVETFEDEFVHGRGLRDEKIIAFFDDHVHDSLAGFDKDSTLPSDPRVVYIGGDRKLDYAKHGDEEAALPT